MIHGRLIAIAALAACAVLPTAAQADTPRLNGRIAYASDDALIHTANEQLAYYLRAWQRVQANNIPLDAPLAVIPQLTALP